MKQISYKESLKKIFRDYKRLSPRVEKELRLLGIYVERQRNHVILNVNGHLIPISCTGSDKRAGLNIASKVIKYYS